MGRRPNAPVQKADGYWYSRHPGLKRTVRLAATTYSEAVAEQQSFYGVASEAAPVATLVSSYSVPASGGSGVLNLDDDNDKPTKSGDANAADILDSLAAKPAVPAATSPTVTADSNGTVPPTNPVQAVSTGGRPLGLPPIKDLVKSGNRSKQTITPEQAATIAKALKKMVVNTNIVVVGAAIDILGYVPAKLDEDEIQLLQMGWEMWLDELLQKAKLKPVHLVIVGNLMIAVSMFAGGTKKAKPKALADATAAKSAPGHASVTPISPPKS